MFPTLSLLPPDRTLLVMVPSPSKEPTLPTDPVPVLEASKHPPRTLPPQTRSQALTMHGMLMIPLLLPRVILRPRSRPHILALDTLVAQPP